MKRSASLLAAVLPLFWFTVAPAGKQYCALSSDKHLLSYTVTHPNGGGQPVQLTFDGQAQARFCRIVGFSAGNGIR